MLDSHSGEGIFRGEEGLKCKPFQVSSPHGGSWEMALHSRGAVQSGVFQASQNSQNLEDWMAIIFLYWIHVIQGRNRVFCFNSLLGHLLSRKGFLSLSEMSISLHWLFCDCVDSSQAFLEALSKADGAHTFCQHVVLQHEIFHLKLWKAQTPASACSWKPLGYLVHHFPYPQRSQRPFCIKLESTVKVTHDSASHSPTS